VYGEEEALGLAMLRSQLQAFPHGAIGSRRLIRTSTAVSRRAELPGSVPGCSDTGHIHSLQVLHVPKQDARTTGATDNGSLAVQYYGYYIVDLYHEDRTHCGLQKQTPESRKPSVGRGKVVAWPRVGGLHHRYERAA